MTNGLVGWALPTVLAVACQITIVVPSPSQSLGDVDFDAVKEKASLITPVPGGVGPMTITMLLYNTVESAKQAAGLDWPP